MDTEGVVETTNEASFTELISDEERLRDLLESSCIHGPDATAGELYGAWEAQRKFIADTIPSSGSVLDYGCANGFLLRCLQAWSPHTIEPWGIDVDDDALDKAKALFPHERNHFMTPQEFVEGEDAEKKFNVVYWNVWGNFDFDEKGLNLFHKLIEITDTGGKTALGFYDTKEKNLAKIAALQAIVPMESVIIENPTGEEVMLVISKS